MNNWKHKIKIKHLFEDETTPELIVKLCDELIRQLDPILKGYETSDDGDDTYYELEAVIDNFEFLKGLADGITPMSDWKEYGFDGNFEKEFDEYMSELYDVANKGKLIWID